MLTPLTLSVMKSFSAINPSIVLQPGNKIKTISNQKSILAEAKVDTNFDSTAGIYDLSKFLGTVSLFTNPEFVFNEKTIYISEGKKKVSYTLSEPSLIVQPPEKDFKLPSTEVHVELSWSQIQDVLKAAAILQLPAISFVGKDGEIVLEAVDPMNPTTDQYGFVIGETDKTFNFNIKVGNIKLMPGDYTVSISSAGLSNFVNENLSYWIAIESNSKFGGK